MVMKTYRILLTAAVALLGLMSWAQTTGEWAKNIDGSPAMSGQTTTDHLFVRTGNYDGPVIDNIVTFNSSEYQLVYLWLDDDMIYQNERVQALTPIPYNSAGDLYHEITYNSFQCDLYLPEGVNLVSFEDEEGDVFDFVRGPRMPSTSTFDFQELNGRKVIDDVSYHLYKLLCTSTVEYGCHFSSKNGTLYQRDGALKKDDAPLIGLCLQIEDYANAVGELPNMIIANQEFGFREAFTNVPMWEPNDYRFIYGTGGNNESQRFQFYQRVRLLGKTDYVFTEKPVISYTMSSSAVTITATGEGEVVLMVNGEQVDNPCTIERGEQDKVVMVTATAKEPGKLISETTTVRITVPARPGVSGDNLLTMPSMVYAETGKDFDMPVALVNSADITALQCDVYLPEGITLIDEGIELVDERVTETHTVTVKPLADGALRVFIASPVSAVINGYEGDLFTLHLNVAPGIPEGQYNLMLGNIVLADADAMTYFAPDVDAIVSVKSYAKGDANGDGLINVGDYVTTANYILEMEPDPFVFSAADVDENQTIDVGDLVGIVNIVLGDFTMPNNAPHQNNPFDLIGKSLPNGDRGKLVTLYLDNDIDFTAWQMDLLLPAGMTLTNASLCSRAQSHNLVFNHLDNGLVRILGSSTANDIVNGHEGALLTLEIEGTNTFEDDDIILLKNIIVAESDMTTHRVGTCFVDGVPISVDELDASLRIYAQGENIVVETPVETTVEVIMVNGMSRTFTAKAGVNTYPASTGINIVRVAGKVAKLTI